MATKITQCKNLYVFGNTPVFGNIEGEESSEIHGITAVVSYLKDSGGWHSFTDCVMIYKLFSGSLKHGQDKIRALIECGILERRGAKGKIKLVDEDACKILYLPMLSQPAISAAYKDYLSTLTMKNLDAGSFCIAAKSRTNKFATSSIDSVYICDRGKFPTSYEDILTSCAVETYHHVNFDCMITRTNESVTSTKMEKVSIYEMSSLTGRRLISPDDFIYNGRWVTDPENPERYMDIMVLN